MPNSRENRIETLNNAGVDTSKFFELNLKVPMGHEVTILVDGEAVTIPCSTSPSIVDALRSASVNNNTVASTTMDFMNPPIPTVATAIVDDPIVQNIMNDGYVFNSRTDGRFVAAQTFKMLNVPSYNWDTRRTENGWDAYLRNNYSYMYQFEMMIDELRKLARMQTNNDPEFAKLSRFFTQDVVIATCKNYIRQLKKFVQHQRKRRCNGRPYVKLNKYGNVFISDLNTRVYNKLDMALSEIKNAGNYTMLTKKLRAFVCIMPKLPYNTAKCSQWKDAFKGKGAYLTLQNIIKFHGVTVQNYETGELLDRDASVAYVDSLLDTYSGSYWRFHEALKAAIALNNFDLQTSIIAQRS